MKRRKTDREYGQYKATITKLRKLGMIRKGQRILTYGQYENLINAGYTKEEIISTQARHNVKSLKEANIIAKEIRERYNAKLKSGRSKRSTASIVKNAFIHAHDDIMTRLALGEDKDEILADYGY